MRKIGKHRLPALVILIIMLTFGLYGFVWFGIVLQELRQYRGKGMPGWILLLPFVILPFGFFGLYIPILLRLLILLILVFDFFVIVVQVVLIPYNIDKEKVKLGLQKKKLVYIGYILLLANIIFYFTTSPYPEIVNQVILFFGFVLLHLLWVYIVQKNLNELWKAAAKTPSFAIPVYGDPTSHPLSQQKVNDDYSHERHKTLEQKQRSDIEPYQAFPDYDTYEESADETDEETDSEDLL